MYFLISSHLCLMVSHHGIKLFLDFQVEEIKIKDKSTLMTNEQA